MNTANQIDETGIDLTKKLHHAHDKIIKIALQEHEAMREFSEKIVMPHLKGIKIDLNNLQLDTTSYISPDLQAFYSDIVYLTSLIDDTTQTKAPVKVALLIEHKSKISSQLLLRLQVAEYINAIMKKNYNKKTDSTIPVLPIIFNQFQKRWVQQPFRSLFPQVSETIKSFIPEFGLIVINLSDLPQETMDSLDEYGTLKATFLAMRNIRNKQFLKQHFEDIFLFLQKHPEKTDLREQLITYLLGQSTFTGEEIEELLNNIFSPILKQKVMVAQRGYIAEAYRKAKIELLDQVKAEVTAKVKAEVTAKVKAEVTAKVKAEVTAKAEEAILFQKRLTVMNGWNGGVPENMIVKMSSLPQQEVTQLIASFEKVKDAFQSKKKVYMKDLKKISNLNEAELKALIALLKQE